MPDKQNLVFMSGLLLDEHMWRDQIEAFAGEFEITVPDCSKHDNVECLARDFLRSAPKRFAIAGLSKGGSTVFEVFKQAPERVTRLALLDTTPLPDTPEATAARLKSIRRVNRGELKQMLTDLLPILLYKSRLLDQPLCRRILGMSLEMGADTFIRQQKAVMNRPDYRDLLEKINVPTLIVCGAEDALTPLPISQDMARRIPGAKLVVIPECGHLSTMEQPDAVNTALREWLAA